MTSYGKKVKSNEEEICLHKEFMLDKLIKERYEPIAIVGVGIRFPGKINNFKEFIRILENGIDCIEEIPKSRWDNNKIYDNRKGVPGKIYTHSGGYIDDFDLFDAKFFSISPKEANNVDPQQRLLLELTWEALEHANIDPNSLRGGNGSVYFGASTIDYAKKTVELNDDALCSQMGTGTANSAIAGRVSYFLGLHGPSMVVDTACSSSLVAVHLAIQALRLGETDISFCGGVNIVHHYSSHVIFSQANMLSPDGRCKTFDDSADGYGRSEGAGVIILKRLSDAITNEDNILAIIRGSSVLQDGESGGLTVPNGLAQEQVMKQALDNSLLSPSDIGYVEAHGTGTPLGDPIEFNAISQVFNEYFELSEPLYISSVKTNIGHMEAAAGIGGIIKVIAQMINGKIYKHLHLKSPSKHIQWDKVSIAVPSSTLLWNDKKKRAIVNSFGFSGTISSLVIEEAPVLTKKCSNKYETGGFFLTVSAKTESVLEKILQRYLDVINEIDAEKIGDFCHLSNIARAHFTHRCAGIVDNKEQCINFLKSRIDLIKNKQASSNIERYKNNKIAFLFSGQGCQYAGMTRDIYLRVPYFRDLLDKIDSIFYVYLNVSIKEIMFKQLNNEEYNINKTVYTQATLFAVEYALAKLWIFWGVYPNILIGHSVGEIVSATISGLFSLEDAIKLVAIRGTLMQSIKRSGGMVAIQASPNELDVILKEYTNISFAAINSPTQSILSGDESELYAICKKLEAQKIPFKKLSVSHAFHSHHMDEMLEEFSNHLKDLRFYKLRIPFISNITGDMAKEEEVSSIEYWQKHVRSTVNFYKGIQAVDKQNANVFIEIGPDYTLNALAKQCVTRSDILWLQSSQKKDDSLDTLKKSIARIYGAGIDVKWQNIHFGKSKCHMDLPTYQFEKKKFWLPRSQKDKKNEFSDIHPLLGRNVYTKDNCWEYNSIISIDEPAYLKDHIVMNKLVFPGAGYIEIVLALQDAALGTTNLALKDVNIIEPLFFQGESTVLIITRLKKIDADHYEFKILSSEDEVSFREHVSGFLENKVHEKIKDNIFNLSIEDHHSTIINVDHIKIYDVLFKKGLEYGPSFKMAKKATIFDGFFCIGEIFYPDFSHNNYINPIIFDAALHIIDPILDNIDPNNTYLPVGFEEIYFLKKPRGPLICKVHLKKIEDKDMENNFTADFSILENDAPILVVKNLKMKKIAPMSEKNINKNIFIPKWVISKISPSSSSLDKVLFINCKRSSDMEMILSKKASLYSTIHFSDGVESTMNFLKENPSCRQIVYFWKNVISDDMLDTIEVSSKYNYEFILEMIKSLNKEYGEINYKFIFVTLGAKVISYNKQSAITNDNILQSSLWGFCNVLRNEYPRYSVKIVDFSVDEEDEYNNYIQLGQEISNPVREDEYQIAYRGSTRYVLRLCPLPSNNLVNFKLNINEYGTFSGISTIQIPIEQPGEEQILVQVYAVGLNFKDVLNALGMLNQHTIKSDKNYSLPLGFECSGIVIAAGKKTKFTIGDEVIVSALGCFQAYITTHHLNAVRKPKNINFYEAAALPTAYITSYYALHSLANMRQGDKILIHAAAGGVGQAAINLAKRVGADIYATASHGKWEYLKGQGIKHIMNSRDTSFKEKILKDTNKKGVDIVLNSLNKDFIKAGLDVLAAEGRFIELGKLNVLSNEQAKKFRGDMSYYNFDLSELPEKELSELNQNVLGKIAALVEKGELPALPTKIYSLDDIEQAFSDLSKGNNIGKFVISLREMKAPSNAKDVQVFADKCYLITGGYGGLGSYAAKWLADRGAKHIALLGRSKPSPKLLNEINMLINQPNVVLIPLQGDISDRKELTTIFSELRKNHPPLGGIIHAAGALDDAPIEKQGWLNFQKVFASKVYGTWLLHEYVSTLHEIDFFICYSSIASVVGSIGQANYAAANSYMDSLMSWRVNSGFQGLSINWGAWAEVGMATQLDKKHIISIENKGVKLLSPESAMHKLYDVTSSLVAQAIIAEIDWSEYVNTLDYDDKLYSLIIKKKKNKLPSVEYAKIITLPYEERLLEIVMVIRATLRTVLHFDTDEDISINAKFSELGLDSLVAVEFKNNLEKTFKLSLKSTVVFDYPSLPDMSEYILKQYFSPEKNKKSIKSLIKSVIS